MQMKRSTVVGSGGAGVVDNIRTSYGMFIRYGVISTAIVPHKIPDKMVREFKYFFPGGCKTQSSRG